MTNSDLRAARSEPTTRREIIARAALGLGGLALHSGIVRAETEEISHAAESIHQELSFKANRNRLYEALTNAAQFDKLIRLGAAMKSGMPSGGAITEISQQVGGAFTIFNGHIIGRHIELVPNERIVQAWRVIDWESGIYSIARFELAEQSAGTKLIFDHTGFPKGLAEHLAAGWKGNYWEPLQKFLA